MYRDKNEWKNIHILFPVPIVLEMVMTSVASVGQNKRKRMS